LQVASEIGYVVIPTCAVLDGTVGVRMNVGTSRGSQHGYSLAERSHPFGCLRFAHRKPFQRRCHFRNYTSQSDVMEFVCHGIFELLSVECRIDVQKHRRVRPQLENKAIRLWLDDGKHLRSNLRLGRQISQNTSSSGL
jgi:hypothetical protein